MSSPSAERVNASGIELRRCDDDVEDLVDWLRLSSLRTILHGGVYCSVEVYMVVDLFALVEPTIDTSLAEARSLP